MSTKSATPVNTYALGIVLIFPISYNVMTYQPETVVIKITCAYGIDHASTICGAQQLNSDNEINYFYDRLIMNSKETLCDLYLLALRNRKRRGKKERCSTWQVM